MIGIRSNNFVVLIFFLLLACNTSAPSFENSLAVFVSNMEGSSTAQYDFFNSFAPHYQRLQELHQPLPVPTSKDWLDLHSEAGQHFFQYSTQFPQGTDQKRKLYFITLGELTTTHHQLLQHAFDYLHVFYQIDPVVLPEIPFQEVELIKARNGKPQKQLYTIDLLTRLHHQVPTDGLGLVLITTFDLFPHPDINYVFGQASAKQQTAVISLSRLGELSFPKQKALVLTRSLKLMSHEIGHMLGFEHCIAFSCNMNGVNHLAELDRTPTWLCPDCLGKLYWNIGKTIPSRFDELDSFWRKKSRLRAKRYELFANTMHN